MSIPPHRKFSKHSYAMQVVLLGTGLMMTMQSISSAQFIDDPKYFVDGFEIPVTEEERRKLYEIDTEHWSEDQGLKAELDKIEKQLQEHQQDTASKVEALLTDKQLQSIRQQQHAAARKRVAENGPFLLNFVKFTEVIAQADEITIYEGLPRAEQEEIDRIKQESKTVTFDEFAFYAKPLAGKVLTIEKLRSLLIDHKPFSPTPPGGKFCGGFHPDICLQYRVAGQEYRTHICLGCSEILAVGPKHRYNFDFNESTNEAFQKIAKAIFVNHERPGR